jgi:hypothetical protein
MKPETFSINKLVAKLMVLGAALVALQPGLLEIVLPVAAATVGWLLLAGRICIRRLFVLLGGLGLAAIGLQYGVSPAFAVAVFVVLISLNFSSLEISGRWLAGWIAVFAVMHLPPFVRLMLLITESVPLWISGIVVPVFFLAVALACGVVGLVYGLISTAVLIVLGYGLYQAEISPYFASILVALPAAITVLFEKPDRLPNRIQSGGILFLGVVLSLVMLLPAVRMPGALSFWVPEAKSSISRFFESYETVLKMSGFRSARMINSAADIAPGDWVVLPSAAHQGLRDQLLALKHLPHYSTLRIIIFGEHTDVDGVASSLKAAGAPVGLNVDTTIPPKNSNLLGWSSGLGAVPSLDVPLNRGASVSHLAWSAVPMVWVHGGHRETDNYEDGSLGDMAMRKGDRAGIYSVISLAQENEGATWIVIGDSTPALNELLAAQPSAMSELLALSTGIPAILGVLSWAGLFFAVAWRSRVFGALLLWLAVASLMLISLSKHHLSLRFMDPKEASAVVVDRPLYGEKAVGRSLVALSKSVVDSDVLIVVGGGPIDSNKKQVVISHPIDWPGRVDCVRAGDVQIAEVRVMDVVACPNQEQEVLLRAGRDPIAFIRDSFVYVLDQHFIANAAPRTNVEWLNSRILELKN